MFHDILLQCICLSKEGIQLNEQTMSNFLCRKVHPSEEVLFHKILDVLNSMSEIAAFVKQYGGSGSVSVVQTLGTPFGPMRCGLYLNSFANGINNVLQDYYEKIMQLEIKYKEKNYNSFIYIYEVINQKSSSISFLKRMIRGIKAQGFHGCGILHYVTQQAQLGDIEIGFVVADVMGPVLSVFISQLANWVLFGKLNDKFAEFFIQIAPDKDLEDKLMSIKKEIAESKFKRHQLQQLKRLEYFYKIERIWQHEINFDLLPNFVSTICAEKILFIGQIVMVFREPDLGPSKKQQNTNKFDLFGHFDLWNGNDEIFLKMLIDINPDKDINLIGVEIVINQIKKYVTKRVSQIASEDKDFGIQMMLIKDYYLLGRGELFLEYLRQTETIVNYVKAFEKAAYKVSATNEIKHFKITLLTQPTYDNEMDKFDCTQQLHLQLLYKWPLTLLFSPKVIERYNMIFRFLLLLKKVQYKMHSMWHEQIWATKYGNKPHSKVLQLQNQLMFFIDRFQFYIQVDVLESQYSVLMDVIHNNEDFEDVYRAHSVFLANVLTQCFLLVEEKEYTGISQTTYQFYNPVHAIITDVLQLTEDYIKIFSLDLSDDSFMQEIERIEERFNVLTALLLRLLTDIKNFSSTPLKRLLLHLDYNHWLSDNNLNFEILYN